MVTPSVLLTSMSWALATKGSNIIANKNSCFFIIVICFNSNLSAKVYKNLEIKKKTWAITSLITKSRGRFSWSFFKIDKAQMKMKQVMSHNINNGLLNIIRRTDPMITLRALSDRHDESHHRVPGTVWCDCSTHACSVRGKHRLPLSCRPQSYRRSTICQRSPCGSPPIGWW